MRPLLGQVFDEELSVSGLFGDRWLDLVANEGQDAALDPTEARELMLVEHFLCVVQFLELNVSRVKVFEQGSTQREGRLDLKLVGYRLMQMVQGPTLVSKYSERSSSVIDLGKSAM